MSNTPQGQGSRRGRPPSVAKTPEAAAQVSQGEPSLAEAVTGQQGDQGNELSSLPGQGDESASQSSPIDGEQGIGPNQGAPDVAVVEKAGNSTGALENLHLPPVQDDVTAGVSATDPLLIKVSNSGHTVLEMRSKVSLIANQVTTIPAKDERDRALILKNLDQMNHLSGHRHLTVRD